MRKIKYSRLPVKNQTAGTVSWLLTIILAGQLSACQPHSSGAGDAGVVALSSAPPGVYVEVDRNLTVQWQPAPGLAEQPIELQLWLPDGWHPEVSEVRGVNMYMGYLPLLWRAADDHWFAVLQVGACSEAQMLWQVTVPLRDDDGQLQPALQFQLQTVTKTTTDH